MGSTTLTLGGSYQNAVFNIDGGGLVLQNDAPTIAGTFNGPGTLTIQSASNSFTSVYSMPSLTFGSTLSGLTVGKTTNTSGITLGSNIGINGFIKVYGGSITQNAGVSVTSGGSDITYTAVGSGYTASDDKVISIGAATGSRAVINAGGGNISLSGSYGTTGTQEV